MDSISSQPSTNNILKNGIVGLLLVLTIAFSFAAIPSPDTYQWLVFFFLAATPAQIIIGILWQNNIPFIKSLGKTAQPAKGLILVIGGILSGLAIGGLTLTFMGKGTSVLTPQLNHFLIIAIIVTLWLVIVVNFWPFIGKIKNITFVGICTLILAYGIAFMIWKVFFSYENVADFAPWYIDFLDPKGLFDFVPAIVFIITTCPIILYLALFDDWFLERWSGSKQPIKAIVNTIVVLAIAFALQSVFVKVVGMDPMVYMVIVPICMVFGVFLTNNMTQFLLFEKVRQPLKGWYKMMTATTLGLLMYLLYYNVAPLLTGQEMVAGIEGNYQLDLWIADTMLGVSFPLIIVVTGFFNFWPFKEHKK